MPTRGELIAEALDAFLQDCTDVEGAAVVSVDGLPMASALPMHFEEDRLAAMTAALLSLGEKATEGLGRGPLGEVHLDGEDGSVHIMAAGPQAVFCCVCRAGAKTGLVLFEMRSAAQRVGRALSAPQPQAYAAPQPPSQPLPQQQPPQHQPEMQHRPPAPVQRPPAQKPPVPVPPVAAPLPGEARDVPKPVAPVPDLHPVHGNPPRA